MLRAIRRVLAPWRLDRSPVTTRHAADLKPGMVLSAHNIGLGVRPAGEKITKVEQGDECGIPVVYVATSGRGVWPLRTGEVVSVLTHSVDESR
jgi:hypothetical protein